MLSRTPLLPTSLPLRKRHGGEPARSTEVVAEGRLPLFTRAVVPGEPLEFSSWVCPGASKDSMWRIQRWVARDGSPLFRFDDAEPVRAGDCAVLRDALETAALEPGSYTYHLRWRPDPEAEASTLEVPFELDSTVPSVGE
jgi:hypothetical protein